MSIARDMAALRERDPGLRCAYCAVPLALPFAQVGSAPNQWETEGWELYLLTGEGEEPFWQLAEGVRLAHRDHVEPSSKGGANHLDNLVLACDECNVKKKARPLLIFLALRAGCPRFQSVGGDYRDVFAKAWAA
jgi:hypothetical protein